MIKIRNTQLSRVQDFPMGACCLSSSSSSSSFFLSFLFFYFLISKISKAPMEGMGSDSEDSCKV